MATNQVMKVFVMMQVALAGVGQKVRNFKDEEHGGSEIIAIVAMAVMAIALAIVFKDAVAGFINSIVEQFEGMVKNGAGV